MSSGTDKTVPKHGTWNPVKLFGGRRIAVRPLRSRPPERFHSAHWWEVGCPGTRKKTVIAQFERHGLRLVDSYHNVFPAYP